MVSCSFVFNNQPNDGSFGIWIEDDRITGTKKNSWIIKLLKSKILYCQNPVLHDFGETTTTNPVFLAYILL